MSDRSMLSPDAEAALLEVEQVIGEAMEAVLPTLLNREVQVRVEGIRSVDMAALRETYPNSYVDLTVECAEGVGWGGRFLFEPKLVAKIADLMMMGDGTVEELAEDHLDAIKETMDQVMAVVGRSLSARFDHPVSYSPSVVEVSTLTEEAFAELDLIAVSLQVKIEDVIESPITQLISEHVIAERLGHPEAPTATAGMPASPASPPPRPPAGERRNEGTEEPSIQPVEFAEFNASASTRSEPRNMDLLLDLTLPISVELGRVMMTIQDILELGQGAIVELDRLAGEPVDLLVNDKKFAEGEVVVVDENFGVRITALVSPKDRLRSLR